MKKIEYHPIANKFTWMPSDEYEAFKDDIKKFGLKHPIIMYEGKILDGRHRYKACQEIGMEAQFKDFHVNGQTPLEFVVSENLMRRHLNISQRSVTGLDLYDEMSSKAVSERNKKIRNGIEDKPLNAKEVIERTTSFNVAKIFGVSQDYIVRALAIRKYAPNLIPRIISGELNISQARKLMPKIRKERSDAGERRAINIMKEINMKDFKMPTPFDSYEKFFGEHRQALNDAGYIMQTVFCARKIYVQIVKVGENFKPWGNMRSEHDFRTAVTCEMRSSVKL